MEVLKLKYLTQTSIETPECILSFGTHSCLLVNLAYCRDQLDRMDNYFFLQSITQRILR
nr:MAG TPA: hypothetical protein [Bacteriophage sp.]